jgi:Fic family protein
MHLENGRRRLSALRRVATIESIGSSIRIEGSKLSDREVAQLLSNLEIKSFATPELQRQIVEFARERGRVTIGEAIKLTGASCNTLEQDFRALVERGTLDQHGSDRGVWYDLR